MAAGLKREAVSAPLLPDSAYGLADAVNMLLQAQVLEIGALWIANTCFAYPELTEFLKEKGQLTGAAALGIADEKPAARPRKPFNEIVEYRLS